MTFISFYDEFIEVPLSEYVSLINAPTDEQLKALELAPIKLKPWDPMGFLAL